MLAPLVTNRLRDRMHVLHWGTFDLGKPRTRILRAGIRATGATLRDCHRPLWTGLEDKIQETGRLQRLWILVRWVAGYPVLVWRFLRGPRPDVVLISFPGVLDTLVLAPFARFRGVPLVLDLFISAYDTLVFDRRLVREGSLGARLVRWVERLALRAADLVFLDTETHARRIEEVFDLPPGSCGAVLVGAESEHFQPRASGAHRPPDGPLQVLFYGQFIPLHGIETIVATARLMQEEAVEWTLIGRGQQAKHIRRLLQEVPLPKLRWTEWVKYAELHNWIAEADLCLGIFGTTEKAASVIPNKVFQTVATGRPIATRDSPAIRELLAHSPPCAYLVPPGDPNALAAAVRAHQGHNARSSCHAPLASRIAAPEIGQQFVALVTQRLGSR